MNGRRPRRVRGGSGGRGSSIQEMVEWLKVCIHLRLQGEEGEG